MHLSDQRMCPENSGRNTTTRRVRKTRAMDFFQVAILSSLVLLLSSRQSYSFTASENSRHSPLRLDQKQRSADNLSRLFSTTNDIDNESQNSVSRLANKKDARAGQDGYSLLRQPLQRDTWDSSTDPNFKAPKKLNDEGSAVDRQNADWWSSKQEQNRNGVMDFNALPRANPTPPQSSLAAEDQTLDLFQRSSDTLDFPIILGALRTQCFTVPAKEIVDEAADQSEKKQSSKEKKASKPKEDPKTKPLDIQPLLANTPQEVREQYQAVFEMQRLLDTDGMTKTDLRGAYYKNRRGIQVTIGNGNPPPLEGYSFDLESILKICSEDGEVLEGPEILEVSTMMNAMEDVQLWAKSLKHIVDDSGSEETNMFVELPRIVDSIELNTTLQVLLEEAFDNEGRLSGRTFPALGQLRAKVRTLKTDILQTLDSIVQLPSVKSKLALESGGPLVSEVASASGGNSGGRLVLPIDPKYASEMGIVHDSSRSHFFGIFISAKK